MGNGEWGMGWGRVGCGWWGGGTIAAMADVLTLTNTATRGRGAFVPADPGHVTFYSCGPTVYDDAHIGNFRSFLVADLLRRWIESPLCRLATAGGGMHAGPRRVTHVMNITDVGHMTEDDRADGGGEDKMAAAGRRLLEAKKAGTLPAGASVDPADPYAIAAFYAGRFREDAARLGLRLAVEAERDPTLMPRATEHVPRMIEIVRALEQRGLAYVRGEAGRRAVYFDVQNDPQYGRLSGNTLEQLRGGAGGRVSADAQAEKKHPADFLLWKEDPRHLMRWASPWGEGYPGWHIECTAMSLGRLDPSGERGEIDLHSGGEDNIFPHHECENAQSCGFTGRAVFARCWVHTRFLMVNGEKMSKRKGTFFTARDLFAQGHEPSALRLELLKTHYMSNADFSLDGLKAGAKTIERLRRFAEAAGGKDGRAPARAGWGAGAGAGASAALAAAHPVGERFASVMNDDLNVAGALGVLNTWMGETSRPTEADGALLAEIDAVLGLLELPRPGAVAATGAAGGLAIFLPGVTPSDEVEALLAQRAAAKKAKDFAEADRIRGVLLGMGLTIKDAPGGKVEVGRG